MQRAFHGVRRTNRAEESRKIVLLTAAAQQIDNRLCPFANLTQHSLSNVLPFFCATRNNGSNMAIRLQGI